MNQKKLILLISLLLLISCTGRSPGESPITTSKDFHKGTSALAMSFLPNSPPKEIYESSSFILGINIKNEGAIDIKDGILSLSVEDDYISLSKTKENDDTSVNWKTDLEKESTKQLSGNALSFSLKGKNIFSPLGEQGYIYITPETKNIPEQSQSLKSTIIATSCYKYKTEAVPTVCIDTDITNTRQGEKSCIIKDISMDSQGAPIAVAKVEYQMLPLGEGYVKPEFIITVENRGNGEVIYPDERTINSVCGHGELPKYSDAENQFTFNVVRLSAYLSGDRQLKCEPSSDDYSAVIRLKDRKGIARCTLKEGIDVAQSSFATPLQISVDYGYTFTISQDVVIKKPAQ